MELKKPVVIGKPDEIEICDFQDRPYNLSGMGGMDDNRQVVYSERSGVKNFHIVSF